MHEAGYTTISETINEAKLFSFNIYKNILNYLSSKFLTNLENLININTRFITISLKKLLVLKNEENDLNL